MNKALLISISLTSTLFLKSQDTLLPLQFNAHLLSMDEDAVGLKSAGFQKIRVDIDSSKYILVDDFSYNNYRPNPSVWMDRSVFINRNFPVNPVTVGVATFDGMNEYGYPYNFITPTSYGACDTLTSLPIELNKVDLSQHAPVYLTFYYQPQGISPFSPSAQDSLTLQFLQLNRFDTTIINNGGVFDTIIDTVRVNKWFGVWGQSGYNLSTTDTSCNFAFRTHTIAVPPALYQDSFQFRFISYGNTSGNVDHWHLDFVVLSSDASGHNELGDYAFTKGLGSMIEDYTALPWFHYRGNESRYARTNRATYHMRNTFGSLVEVDLEYRADNSDGVQMDSIIPISVTPITARNCKKETMPPQGDDEHTFIFRNPGIPVDTTTYFIKKNILKRRIGAIDLIELNNQVDEYQIFGTYYAYDDGSAEAGYGLKADKGKVALQFIMPPGITDTLTSFYIHFNPVVVDRSNERFRLTVWANEDGFPGDIIYENSEVGSPRYLKQGVNHYDRWFLNEPVLVSDTFYIGYQKITGDVMNIGYDMNNKKRDKIFISTGGAWTQGGSVPQGALMMRPSFRHLNEPQVGIKKVKKEIKADVKIYPNPASDHIYIRMEDNNVDFLEGSIYSLEGRMIQTFDFRGEERIDISSLPGGMYLMVLKGQSGIAINKKFLILR